MPDPIPTYNHKSSALPALWLAIVGVVGLVERLLVILLYQPVAYSDSASYRRLADTVLQGFNGYDGTRTPGYPVFLALVGNDQRVWVVQLFLGLVTTLLLFYIGWKLTDKPWFGGAVALLHTLNLGQLFFESNLLTESLTTFLIVLCVLGMLLWYVYPKTRRVWLAFLIGICSTLTLLVRPLFIYLPFLLLFFLWLAPRLDAIRSKPLEAGDAELQKSPVHHQLAWQHGLAFAIPVIALLGGWLFYMHRTFDEWSLTTMTGYHLVQHTGSFFEYVPDEYSTLRDIYIKYRDAQIAQYGTQTNAIWDAIPEMSQVSGYSFYALSRVLTNISIQLILHHPVLYIKNSISGWWMFWRVPVYWSADAFRIQWLTGGIKLLIQLERGGVFIINMLFIIASIDFVITESVSMIRRDNHKTARPSLHNSHPVFHTFLWLLLGNIWIASILQTLLDHGDNPRFLVPLQSLVVLWVAAFIQYLVSRKQAQSTPAPIS